MKRIRQIVVALVGLFYVALLYPLCTELWRSKWLIEMHDNECEPMFITFLVTLGVFSIIGCGSHGLPQRLAARRCWLRLKALFYAVRS